MNGGLNALFFNFVCYRHRPVKHRGKHLPKLMLMADDDDDDDEEEEEEEDDDDDD